MHIYVRTFDYKWHLVHVETSDVCGQDGDTDIDGADQSALPCN